jgi:hypothetical protein
MDELRGSAAEPEKHAQEVADGLLAALQVIDASATVAVEIAAHPYMTDRKLVRLNTTVHGREYPVSIGIDRRSTSRFSRTYTEALQIETGLTGMRHVKPLKSGTFNFPRIAEGIAAEATRRNRQAEAEAKRADNGGAHKALIDSINALDSYTARPSASEAYPIHIGLRIDSDLTPEKAEIVLRFLREFKATA